MSERRPPPPRPRKAAAKRPAAKKVAAKRPAAKKTAAKRPAAKKTAARRPAAKKVAAKRPAAKKTAAKKTAARRPAAPVDPRIVARRRSVREAALRRQRRVVTSVVVLALALGGAYAISRSPLFAVGEVRLTGVTGEQAEEALLAAAVPVGANVLDIDTGAVAARIEGLPWVKQAVVRRAPAAIDIQVVPRLPAAVVRIGRAAWVVDEGGWLLGGGAPSTLASVEAPGAVVPPLGERFADQGIRNALKVRAGLPKTLRAMVVTYHAPSARGLRLLLQAPREDPNAQDTGDPSAPPRPPPPVGAQVWVRFGLAERIDAKAKVIMLLLAQAREQAASQGRAVADSELPPGIAELDVRAPDNPVLVPTGAAA